ALLRGCAGGAERCAGGAAPPDADPQAAVRPPGARSRVRHAGRRAPRTADRHHGCGGRELRDRPPCRDRPRRGDSAQDPGDPPLHRADADQRLRHPEGPDRAGGDRHGRLRQSGAQALHLARRDPARPGAVHRLQALLQERQANDDAETGDRAVSVTGIHTVSVRVRLIAAGMLPVLAALSLLPAPLAAQVPWEYRAPTEARRTASIAAPDLTEASGLAASSAHPGVLWTIQDSGNPPDLFAIDTTGAVRSRWRVSGVRNVDWEAISVGPCGARACIYIGDTGDNNERRGVVSIHRLAEPAPANSRGGGRIEEVETLRFRYPDGAHDVEALVV